MSKKSRRRNKKILAALALAGGAAMLAKGRGKGPVSTAGQAVGVDRITPPSKFIQKKVVPEAVDTQPIIEGGSGGDGGVHQDRPKKLWLEKQARAHLPKGPPGWDNPYTSRVISGRLGNRLKGGGIAKRGTGVALAKGGRVTGIAKRGFGRALMKGKK
tara:strand:+ start:107 stop:580 length:474 start_codon:yes stop_codon:yes gene_type:complete